MRKRITLIKIATIVLVVFSLFLSSWYVLHKDINFFTDIARDFLLFQEIDQKKIILIGPRSSAGGLFHGPLWLYLNYPAYVIGHGNPIVVGWYWIFLIAVFLGISFWVAKKLFNEKVACLYALSLAVYLVPDANRLFNPFGAFFVMPLLFYYFITYLKTQKVKYLLFHVIIIGFIIHFQMAVGIPLLLLSFAAIVQQTLTKRKLWHLTAYAALLIVLANYILFDLRHNFLLLHGILHNASPAGGNIHISFLSLLQNRLQFFVQLPILRDTTSLFMILSSLVFFIFFIFQMRDKKYKQISFFAGYFYLGYLILSLASRNYLLTPQFLPMIPLVMLIFSSFIVSKFSKAFFVFFIVVYLLNMNQAILFVRSASAVIGKSPESWQFLFHLSQKVSTSKDAHFGYFVYSPDSFGYQPKYAMLYASKLSPGKSDYLKKETITYIVSAPPPPNNLYMHDTWWITNVAHIIKPPESTITFANGYAIKRYILTQAEQQRPNDSNIDVGLFFR